jgi:hypothetical protein
MGFRPKYLKRRWHKQAMNTIANAILAGAMFQHEDRWQWEYMKPRPSPERTWRTKWPPAGSKRIDLSLRFSCKSKAARHFLESVEGVII